MPFTSIAPPSPKLRCWKHVLFGWYLPAIIALLWLTGPWWIEWITRTSSLAKLLHVHRDAAHDWRLLRYLLGGLLTLRIMSIAMQPKRWQVLGLASLTVGVGWMMVHVVTGPRFLAAPTLWQIKVNQLDFYAFTLWHGLVGAVVSVLLVAIAHHRTPAHDWHWSHWVRDWFCMAIIVTMLLVIISGTTCDCQQTVELNF